MHACSTSDCMLASQNHQTSGLRGWLSGCVLRLIMRSYTTAIDIKLHCAKVRSRWVGVLFSCYQLCISQQNRPTDIAKVAPVLSAKSPWGLVAPAVRYIYIVYAYSHTCLWHTLDLEESCTHCTVIKLKKNLQVMCFTCAWSNSTTHRHAIIEIVYYGAAHYLLPDANSMWTYFSSRLPKVK